MPEQITHLNKPQINISCPSSGRMWLIFGCALACVIQSSISDGGKSLVIALTALLTSLLTEFLFTFKKSRLQKIKDGSAAVTALILALLLPNNIHPFHVFFAAFFAIAVVKYCFGGLGANWLNPALGGWLLIRFSWPSAFTQALGDSASVSRNLLTENASAAGNTITEFLNKTVFSVSGVEIPFGYIDLFFNSNQGLITDRGIITLLIGTVIITAIGINRAWIPLVFLTVYGFLIRLAGDLSGVYWNGDVLYGFFSGGTIAAAFILAAEPSSSAKLTGGVVFSVALGAVLSWFFRYKCLEYSGCFIALALTNSLTPLIRVIEDKFFFSRITLPGSNYSEASGARLNQDGKFHFKNIRFDDSDSAGDNLL